MLQAMGLPPAPLPAKSSIWLLISSSAFPSFPLAKASFDHESTSTVTATWHLLATSPFLPQSLGHQTPQEPWLGVAVWPELSSAPGRSRHILLADDKRSIFGDKSTSVASGQLWAGRLCQRVLHRDQESTENEEEEEETISSSQGKGSLGDQSHPAEPPGMRSQKCTPSPMPIMAQGYEHTGSPTGHWSALCLSQHIRYEHCSLQPRDQATPGPFFTCPEPREPSAQTHPHSQHPAWPDLPVGEMWISVGTTSGATDQPVEGPTSTPATPADQV